MNSILPRFVIALLLVSGAPWAADAREPSPEAHGLALVEHGAELQKAGEHEAAIAEFDQALEVIKHPKVLFLKARSLVALDRCKEAVVLYDLIKNDPKLKQDDVAEIDVNRNRCATTSVVFDAQGRTGVLVEVNDRPVGKIEAGRELRLPLQSGVHSVRASCLTCVQYTTTIVVPDQGPFRVTLDVKEQPKAAVDVTPPPVAVVTPAASRRSPWTWALLGTGVASGAAGLALFGHYAYVATADHEPGQKLSGGVAQLAIAGGLTAVGAGLIVGAFLLPTSTTSVAIVPGPQGGVFATVGGGF